MKEKLKKIPLIGQLIKALELIKLPGVKSFSVYDLIEMYLLGIIRGAFTAEEMLMDKAQLMCLTAPELTQRRFYPIGRCEK